MRRTHQDDCHKDERERKKEIERGREREDLKMFIGTKSLELMIALNMI